MTFKKLASALLLAAGLPVASQAATISVPDGFLDPFNATTFSPFGGIDWVSTSPAYVTGAFFAPNAPSGSVSNPLDLYYFSAASSLQRTVGPVFSSPGLTASGDNSLAGFYEITTVTKLQEIATCSIAANASGICEGTLNFSLVSGSWAVWMDDTPDANFSNGTGFTGTAAQKLLGGLWTSTTGSFNAATGTGNQLDLLGQVTYTNNAFINPNLVGTNASSTLQIFGQTTAIVVPTQMPLEDGSFVAVNTNGTGNAVFQADANQSFTEVPEPGSLLLMASAAFGLFGASRRARDRK